MEAIMKLLIMVGLLFTATLANKTLASTGSNKTMLWPRLTVWPTGVDLNIQNFTPNDYSCSGSIFITHASRRITTEYYFGRVFSRGFVHRRFFNRFYNDRIITANHSVYCFRI